MTIPCAIDRERLDNPYFSRLRQYNSGADIAPWVRAAGADYNNRYNDAPCSRDASPFNAVITLSSNEWVYQDLPYPGPGGYTLRFAGHAWGDGGGVARIKAEVYAGTYGTPLEVHGPFQAGFGGGQGSYKLWPDDPSFSDYDRSAAHVTFAQTGSNLRLRVTVQDASNSNDFHGTDVCLISLQADASAPPAPSLSAYPAAVTSGGSVTLTFSSTNATSLSLDQGIGPVSAYGGTVVVHPTTTTTYTLTATGLGGSGSAAATVTVSATPPPTAALSASPGAIASGGSSTLSWQSSQASSLSLDPGIGSVSVPSGSVVVSPTVTTTYTLSATGSGGSSSATATVTVSAPSPPPPTVYGCTDRTAANFNPYATTDDGSCVHNPPPPVWPC